MLLVISCSVVVAISDPEKSNDYKC